MTFCLGPQIQAYTAFLGSKNVEIELRNKNNRRKI